MRNRTKITLGMGAVLMLALVGAGLAGSAWSHEPAPIAPARTTPAPSVTVPVPVTVESTTVAPPAASEPVVVDATCDYGPERYVVDGEVWVRDLRPDVPPPGVVFTLGAGAEVFYCGRAGFVDERCLVQVYYKPFAVIGWAKAEFVPGLEMACR